MSQPARAGGGRVRRRHRPAPAHRLAARSARSPPPSPTGCARRRWPMLVVEPASPTPVVALDEPAPTLRAGHRRASRGRGSAGRLWPATWPKLAAIALALSCGRSSCGRAGGRSTCCPAPATVFDRARRADRRRHRVRGRRDHAASGPSVGFGLAVVIGVVVGGARRRRRGSLRSAVGSLITGLQTMPSIAWFPLAILLFQLSEGAIMFVVVLGAAPSIANGLITGVDHIPPILLRAGRVIGADGQSTVPPRRAAGVAAVVRRRAQAGLGVRLAQPDGRRAARDRSAAVGRLPAAAVPQPQRRRRA